MIHRLFQCIYKYFLLLIETGYVPDFITRLGIRFLLMLKIITTIVIIKYKFTNSLL